MLWRRDIIYGVVTALFGLFMIYKTSQVPLLGDVEPIAGARYYLYPWFGLLFVLGISLAVQGLVKKKQTEQKEDTPSRGGEERAEGRFLPLPTLFTLIALILYLFLIKAAGYQAATVLFLFILFTGYYILSQEEGLKSISHDKKGFITTSAKYLLLSIAVVVLIQIVFGTILDVRFPG